MTRVLTLLMSLFAASGVAAEDVTYQTADGVTVHATLEHAMGGDFAPLILLFHQAGANGRAEYEAIAPKLLDEGYSVLIVDQRSGGSRFGGENRTAAAFPENPGYCAAYPDLIASLDYVQSLEHDGPIFVWGSSYSAGLVVKMAAERGFDLAGGLAFSPAAGGAMADCNPNTYIDRISVPFLPLRPIDELERPSTQYQADLFTAAGFRVYVAEDGVHGSSMLDKSRTGKSVRRTWRAVFGFLDESSRAWSNRPVDAVPEKQSESEDGDTSEDTRE